VSWGVREKSNKSSAKIKALFQKRSLESGFARFIVISLVRGYRRVLLEKRALAIVEDSAAVERGRDSAFVLDDFGEIRLR
jgi:hypothetical protein